jgi:hypothetical protein
MPSIDSCVGMYRMMIPSEGQARRRRRRDRIVSIVDATRGSDAGRKPTKRDHQDGGIEARSSRTSCCERADLGVGTARSQTSSWISSRIARHLSIGHSNRASRRSQPARSNATQHITFEWVK